MPRDVEAPARRRHAAHVARHPRRLAEQHLERHVDRRIAEQRVAHAPAGRCRRSRRSPRTDSARAPRSRANCSQRAGLDDQHVALLRLVAPDLQRRHAGLRARHGAQVDARAALAVRHGLRHRVRQTARAHVVDQQRWDCRSPSAQQRSMTSCARRCISGVAALHGGEIEVRARAPLPSEEAAPPPSPMSIAGPPSTTSFGADRHLALLDVRRAARCPGRRRS